MLGLPPLKKRSLAVRARLRPFLTLVIKPKRQMHFRQCLQIASLLESFNALYVVFQQVSRKLDKQHMHFSFTYTHTQRERERDRPITSSSSPILSLYLLSSLSLQKITFP